MANCCFLSFCLDQRAIYIFTEANRQCLCLWLINVKFYPPLVYSSLELNITSAASISASTFSARAVFRPTDHLRKEPFKDEKKKIKKGFESCPNGIWLRQNSMENCFGTNIHLLPLPYTGWYKIHLKMLDFRAWITSSLFNTHICITLNFLSVKGQFKFCLYPKTFPFLISNGMHSFYYTIPILGAYCRGMGWGELSN